MRRELQDEIWRSALAINAMLRTEIRDVRAALAARKAEAKYNPNWLLQPHAPRGSRDGGQWVDEGGAPKQAPRRTPTQPASPSVSPPPPVNDNTPPSPAIRFGPAAALATGDVVLRGMTNRTERARVAEAIAQFGLDHHSALYHLDVVGRGYHFSRRRR